MLDQEFRIWAFKGIAFKVISFPNVSIEFKKSNKRLSKHLQHPCGLLTVKHFIKAFPVFPKFKNKLKRLTLEPKKWPKSAN